MTGGTLATAIGVLAATVLFHGAGLLLPAAGAWQPAPPRPLRRRPCRSAEARLLGCDAGAAHKRLQSRRLVGKVAREFVRRVADRLTALVMRHADHLGPS
jgi:hypothetical protein